MLHLHHHHTDLLAPQLALDAFAPAHPVTSFLVLVDAIVICSIFVVIIAFVVSVVIIVFVVGVVNFFVVGVVIIDKIIGIIVRKVIIKNIFHESVIGRLGVFLI